MGNSVGHRIRTIRMSKGMTGTFLSKRLGIHHSTLSKYEIGDRKVDADFLPTIAKALDVDVGVFFEEEIDDTSNKTVQAR